MSLTKTQIETLEDMEKIIRKQGKSWTFGWMLGLLLAMSKADLKLRLVIKEKSRQD